MSFCKQSALWRSLLVAVVALALVFSQIAAARAYGANGSAAGYSDVRAMVDFRIPKGVSQTDNQRVPSFGFTVKRQFRFNDPINETLSASYRKSQYLTVDVMDLRFGIHGKLIGFDLGGYNALQAKRRLSAAEDGDDGLPAWAWLSLGTLAVLGVAAAVALSKDPKCTSGRDGPEIPCPEFGTFP